MTENLRLILDSDIALTSDDSNVSSIWTPHNSTTIGTAGATNIGTTWGNDTDSAIEAAITSENIADDDKANFRASYYDHSYMSADAQKDQEGNTQQIGVYYNWNAATAGTGAWTTTSAPDSICPKGWQLPNDGTGDKTWHDLITNDYIGGTFNKDVENDGINIKDNILGVSASNPGISTDSLYQTVAGAHIYALSQSLRREPFSLAFTGNVDYSDALIHTLGNAGYWWISTGTSRQGARLLVIRTGHYSPLMSYSKGYGFSIRCVAQ